MNPIIPVSWGELIDKLTILEIKAERLVNATARANVERESSELARSGDAAAILNPGVIPLKAALKQINERLWSIEDEIRQKEARQEFDADFIRLARAVYTNNDERGRLKSEINLLLKSEITEEKQYAKY
jgi:hypothetical protein